MKISISRYILVVTCFLFFAIPSFAQNGWELRDPVDLGFIDFGDNKLIAYNLIGYGLSELLDKRSKDSTKVYSVTLANYYEYRREPLTNLLSLGFKGGKQVRKYLTLGLSGHLQGMVTEGEFVPGIGGRVWFAWHILNKEKIKISYDNGVGPNYFTTQFPSGGTRFNFSSVYGLEFEFKIDDRWLAIRATNIHISNADIKGRDRNPALDAVGLRLSYTY